MQYFKHSSSMRNDVKIKRVIAKFGLEGYGLYNLVVEAITEHLDTDNPMPFLEETCDDIAEFYNCNSKHVEEMMKYMIDQGLFSVETVEKRIACFKLYSFLEKSQTRSDKIKELIDSYKVSSKLLGLEECHGLSETNLIEQTITDTEHNRTENKKTNKKKEYSDDFLTFWEAYPKKQSKDQAYKEYKSQINAGRTLEDIIAKLDIYKSQIRKNKVEEKYIRYPSTFLHNLDDYSSENACKSQSSFPTETDAEREAKQAIVDSMMG